MTAHHQTGDRKNRCGKPGGSQTLRIDHVTCVPCVEKLHEQGHISTRDKTLILSDIKYRNMR